MPKHKSPLDNLKRGGDDKKNSCIEIYPKLTAYINKLYEIVWTS